MTWRRAWRPKRGEFEVRRIRWNYKEMFYAKEKTKAVVPKDRGCGQRDCKAEATTSSFDMTTILGAISQVLEQKRKPSSFSERSMVANVAHGIEAYSLQFEALETELFHIEKGKTLGTFWPQPIVYLGEKGAENLDGSALLEVSTCSLC